MKKNNLLEEINSITEKQDKISENISILMSKNGINEAILARDAQIPQATLHKIISGKTTDPRASTLKILADYFNVTVDNLMSSDNIIANISNGDTATIQSVPIISWNECLKGKNFIEKLSPITWKNWITIGGTIKNAYALNSRPSIETTYPIGTILIIDPNIKPEDGDKVIVKYKNADDAALRELLIDGPNKFLKSISYEPKKELLSNQVSIIGVLTQSIHSLHER